MDVHACIPKNGNRRKPPFYTTRTKEGPEIRGGETQGGFQFLFSNVQAKSSSLLYLYYYIPDYPYVFILLTFCFVFLLTLLQVLETTEKIKELSKEIERMKFELQPPPIWCPYCTWRPPW